MELFFIVKYGHFLGIFMVVGGLLFQLIALEKVMSRAQLKKVLKADSIYGLGAMLVTAMGLWMWLGGIAKPGQFYSGNYVFLTKFFLFILVGLLSIYPTVFFTRRSKGQAEDHVNIPTIVRRLVQIEVTIVFLIPFLAILMSRGISFSDL